MDKIKVYAKLDENNVIISINSSIFLRDTSNWVEIAEGMGDIFAHAQGNYLEKGLIDGQGNYNYKLVDNVPTLLTDEEKEALFTKEEVETEPSVEERLETLESAMLEMILGGME